MKAIVNHPAFNVLCVLATINVVVFLTHRLLPIMIEQIGLIPTGIVLTIMGWFFGKLARMLRNHIVEKYNKEG